MSANSRAYYEDQIRDLNAKMGALKSQLTKAKELRFKDKYGFGVMTTLKTLKDELNQLDFI